jgi:hypothetical protein
MSEQVTSVKVEQGSPVDSGCGVVLQEIRLGRHRLRTERDDTGTHLYYVDDVEVDVNRYLEIVQTVTHNRPHGRDMRLTSDYGSRK